jgi:Zn-dependent protease
MAGLSLPYLALFIPVILIAITFHEFAHARVALAFGDHTAEEQGRVTLNPIAHLDPIGTLAIFVAGFGWGKPVPVNPHHMSHPRADFFVSAAGPASNFVIATVAGISLHALAWTEIELGLGARTFLYLLIQTNLMLGLFNLLPIFPLDGSHMLENLLPLEPAYRFKRFSEAYGMPILFTLIIIGRMGSFSPIGFLLGPPMDFLLSLLVPR